MATLHLFRGHPGSSKSTSAKKMFPGTALFENDQYLMQDGKYCWSKERVREAIDWCIASVRNALEHGMDCCVANTFTKRRYVALYERIALDYGAKFDVYRCIGDFQNTHGLCPKMVQNFKDAMEDWPGETIVDPST